MTALYVLAAQYQHLADQLASMDLDATTVADTIEASGLVDDFSAKAVGIEMVARSMEMSAPAIDAEIDRLTALKKQRQKAAAGLRAYLLHNMQESGIEKLESPLFKISVRANPPAVDIFEPGLVPAEFMHQPAPPPPSPNKTAINAEIKEGREVQGARLTTSYRLEVK